VWNGLIIMYTYFFTKSC